MSTIFNFEIFPADIYLLEQLPSETSLSSIILILLIFLIICALASYLPVISDIKNENIQSFKV